MKSKNKKPLALYSPQLMVFGPSALEKEVVVDSQVRFDEHTIRWGPDDALPMRILAAVEESPTTTSCLDRVREFIQGSGFADEGLMSVVVDKHGTTLWELHQQICEYYSLLDGFAVNFKYTTDRKIASAYCIGMESCRFVKPQYEKSKIINTIKYNPYFGTGEYDNKFTEEYQAYDPKTVYDGFNQWGNKYLGQIYFYGAERPLYKFYPVPKYWTGKKWIYVDGQIQEFHKNNLDNGFFQSTLMTVVGDPDEMSTDPSQMREIIGTDDVKRYEPTKTVGEMFSAQMSNQFSGVKKAGAVFVRWVKNKDEAVNIETFPVNTNFDVLSGTFTDAIRGITIATKVPAILANLPQQASSLGSDGNSIQRSVELLQSVVAPKQRVLENFYNNILLPNLQTPIAAKVKIKNYSPVTLQVEIQDKFWEILSSKEKINFIKDNVTGVNIEEQEDTPVQSQRTLIEVIGVGGSQALMSVLDQYANNKLTLNQASNILQILFGIDSVKANRMLQKETLTKDENGEIVKPEKSGNEQLKELNLRQLDRIGKIKDRFIEGKITEDEAKTLLKAYGFTDEEMITFLRLNGEEEIV